MDRAMATAVRSTSSPLATDAATAAPGAPAQPAKRSAAASATRYIAAQEGHVRAAQRGHAIQRAHPRGADDRRPVDRLAQEPLPGVELGAEQVRLSAAQTRQDSD